MAEKPSNPHDALFKRVFSETGNAAGLLRVIAPPVVVAAIDWSSLRLEPASFVDDRLGDRHADLLFSVTLGDRQALIYLLLEHQSGSDALMPYRLLRYVVRIWETWLRDHEDARLLPLVLPVVVHHSEHGWTAATELSKILDADAEILDALGGHIPSLRVLLDDLSYAGDSDLRARAQHQLALLGLRLLVHARYSHDLLADLIDWREAFLELLAAPNGLAALACLIEYILGVGDLPEDGLRDFMRALGPDSDEVFMTTAEQLRAEGRAEGRAEKGADVVLRLLAAKFGPLSEHAIARVRAASLEDLDRFVDRILDAETLDDILD